MRMKKTKTSQPTVDRVFGYVSFAFIFLIFHSFHWIALWIVAILLLMACYEIGKLSVDLRRK